MVIHRTHNPVFFKILFPTKEAGTSAALTGICFAFTIVALLYQPN